MVMVIGGDDDDDGDIAEQRWDVLTTRGAMSRLYHQQSWSRVVDRETMTMTMGKRYPTPVSSKCWVFRSVLDNLFPHSSYCTGTITTNTNIKVYVPIPISIQNIKIYHHQYQNGQYEYLNLAPVPLQLGHMFLCYRVFLEQAPAKHNITWLDGDLVKGLDQSGSACRWEQPFVSVDLLSSAALYVTMDH